MLNVITSYTIWAIFAIIGICGFVGAFLAATTREDAFEVADRQKENGVGSNPYRIRICPHRARSIDSDPAMGRHHHDRPVLV